MATPTGSPLVRIVALAAALALSVLILVVGCAIEGIWWSLFTAACYLGAILCWVLFLPGFICGAPQTGFGAQQGTAHALGHTDTQLCTHALAQPKYATTVVDRL